MKNIAASVRQAVLAGVQLRLLALIGDPAREAPVVGRHLFFQVEMNADIRVGHPVKHCI